MNLEVFTMLKEGLGLSHVDTAFDTEIQLHMSSAINELQQVGVTIDNMNHNPTWDDFKVPSGTTAMIQSYIILYVRMLFDPPSGTIAGNYQTETLNRLLWRIKEQCIRKEDNNVKNLSID